MMEFFRTVGKSIYNPRFYAGIPARTLGSAFGYFFTLMLWVALVVTIFTSISVIPKVTGMLNSFGSAAMNYYPDGLEITAKSGKISTNVPEPYFFKMPEAFRSGFDQNASSGTFENLLVIDTKDPFSIDLFKQYNTVALLTQDTLVTYDKNNSIKIQSLDSVPDGTLTKAKVISILNVVNKVFKFIPAIVVIGIFVGVFIWHAFELLYLVFGALLIWLILKIKGAAGDYGTSYKIGLYAVTPALFLMVLMNLLGVSVPFLFTIVFIVAATFNLQKPKVGEAA